MKSYTDVLFEEITGNDANLGLITLNRPQVLNSLDHGMINAIHAQLKRWATATYIKAVVIRATEGRAFCAGGDLRLTYEHLSKQDKSIAHFFRDEYQLNRFIFHFPKPYIALLDGITMGGGVGISIHGSHRVATDRLLFAMPETSIGFFPDVGGSYFLPRLPGKFGFYLGLTGKRVASDDCVALGIAQHKVASESLPHLIRALANTPFGEDAQQSVTHIIETFKISVSASLLQQQAEIDLCFAENIMEDIFKNLETSNHPLCKEASIALKTKSPTSLKITLQALQLGQQLDFDACMRQEFRLASHFIEQHDFLEGIRAVIIDKDQTPHWQPNTLQDVSAHQIAKYFEPMINELT